MTGSTASANVSAGDLSRGLPWVLFANLAFTVSAGVLALVLPRVMPLSDFAVWQLYLFYALYLGYVTFGYTDGVVLRLGGVTFGRLRSGWLGGSLVVYTMLEGLVFVAFGWVVWLYSDGSNVVFVLACIGSCAYVPRTFISAVLQVTGRSRTYAIGLVVERCVLLLAVLVLIVGGQVNSSWLMLADLVGKFLGLVVCGVMAWGGLRSGFRVNLEVIRSLFADCRVGLPLLFANLAAVSVPGVVRLFVERSWGLEAFANASLAFQLSSMVTIAVTALSVSIFPNLARLDENGLKAAHGVLRSRFVAPAVFGLIFGPAMYFVLSLWIPKYSIAVLCGALLLPCALYESKSRGVANAILRVQGRQGAILVVNLVSLVVSVPLAWAVVVWSKSLLMAVFVVLVVSWIRSLLMEFCLRGVDRVRILRDLICETLVVAVYVLAVASRFSFLWVLLFFLTLLAYGIVYRRELEWMVPRRRRAADGGPR